MQKVEYTHKKQTGGSGQFGRVIIDIAPTGGEGDGGYEFEDKITGGRIPKEYIPRWTPAARRPWSSASSPATRWWMSR